MRMRKYILRSSFVFVLSLLFVGFFGFFSAVQTEASEHVEVLYPVGDAVVFSGLPNQNFGSVPELEVSYSSSGATKLSFMKFDIGSLPEDAQITQGRFYLYKTDCGGNMSPNELKIGQVSTNWKESTVTWATRPNFYPGTSRPGDCNALNWWSLDATQMLRNWQNGQNNYGIALYSASTLSYYRVFLSREYGGLDFQPQLEIYYTVEDPIPQPDEDDSNSNSQDSAQNPPAEPIDDTDISENPNIEPPTLIYINAGGDSGIVSAKDLESSYEVVKGATIALVGVSAPNTKVFIYAGSKTFETNVDPQGVWSIVIDTNDLDSGTVQIEGQSVSNGQGSEKKLFFELTNTDIANSLDSGGGSLQDFALFGPLISSSGSTLFCLILLCCCPLSLSFVILLLLSRKRKDKKFATSEKFEQVQKIN